MTDILTPAALPPETQSRSLFQLAAMRFRRNRAAMAGCVVLALIAMFSFLGPYFISHSYDQVFPSYVTIPPSLEARPDASSLQDVMQGVAGRARVDLKEFAVEGQTFTATVTSDKPIDPRATRYFDRANEFDATQVVATEDDGKTLKLTGSVSREYFLFGTDSNGRDLMARVMLGGQISIAVGLLASLVSLSIGVLYGATSGYIGGRIDNVMMRFVEILYSLPFVFLVVVLVVFFGRSFILIFLVIGAVEWLDMARIVRGQTLALKRREFIGAAQALGLTDWQIIRRHIIPNTIGPVVVFVTVVVPKVILLESFLSFLGLGVQAPLTSWGALIAEGANNIQSAPWLLIFPAIFFVLTLFSLNFAGDGLRDALDPKDR
ncbi:MULTISPECIES: ABC transporter permease [unclassified Rhizobium]|uniref:ABC transporter permease n=1 Tax=unclassified Rhizobium TaxID=2613769 RepID=UPI000715C9F7|nr:MULTISPECIES: ABC transporter permease subunit [unclassified Rhizobium]KQS87620.1 peptide ABC transporter permease [Rhizobium sp. Leaf391]KQT07056.1 peptide ABC transporter permease [Rhizobium sp. Leaf386]KQT95182.1 peptide ABC transporter permease [Rhizobium sp. Leaf453]